MSKKYPLIIATQISMLKYYAISVLFILWSLFVLNFSIGSSGINKEYIPEISAFAFGLIPMFLCSFVYGKRFKKNILECNYLEAKKDCETYTSITGVLAVVFNACWFCYDIYTTYRSLNNPYSHIFIKNPTEYFNYTVTNIIKRTIFILILTGLNAILHYSTIRKLDKMN